MAAVRSKNTSPEIILRRALHAAGLRRAGAATTVRAPGTPDIAFVRRRVAVFIDGAFWHGHPSQHRPGGALASYWDEKIALDIERDRRIDGELRFDLAGPFCGSGTSTSEKICRPWWSDIVSALEEAPGPRCGDRTTVSPAESMSPT